MNEKSGFKCLRCGSFISITEVKEWVSCPACGDRIRLNWGVRDPKTGDNEQQTKTNKDDD